MAEGILSPWRGTSVEDALARHAAPAASAASFDPVEAYAVRSLVEGGDTEKRVREHRLQVMEAVRGRRDQAGGAQGEAAALDAATGGQRPLEEVVKGLTAAKRACCALCDLEFLVGNLPGQTTRSAVLRLRRRWGRRERDPKHGSATYYYGAVPLCRFCMQFFDAEGELPDPLAASSRGALRPSSPAYKFFIGRDRPLADVQSIALAAALDEHRALAEPPRASPPASADARAPTGSTRSSSPRGRASSRRSLAGAAAGGVSDEDLRRLGAAARRAREHLSPEPAAPAGRTALIMSHRGSPMLVGTLPSPAPSPSPSPHGGPASQHGATDAGSGAALRSPKAGEAPAPAADGSTAPLSAFGRRASAARDGAGGGAAGSAPASAEEEAAEAGAAGEAPANAHRGSGGESSAAAADSPSPSPGRRVRAGPLRFAVRDGPASSGSLLPSPGRRSPQGRPSPPTALPSRAHAIGADTFSRHELQRGGLFDSSAIFRPTVAPPAGAVAPLAAVRTRRRGRRAPLLSPQHRVPPDVNTCDNTTNAGARFAARQLAAAERRALEQAAHRAAQGKGRGGRRAAQTRAGAVPAAAAPAAAAEGTGAAAPPAAPVRRSRSVPKLRSAGSAVVRKGGGGGGGGGRAARGSGDNGGAAAPSLSAAAASAGTARSAFAESPPREVPLEAGRARVRGAADGRRALGAQDLLTSGPADAGLQRHTSDLVRTALGSSFGAASAPQLHGARGRGAEGRDASVAMLLRGDWAEPTAAAGGRVADRRPLLVDYHMQRLRARREAAGMQSFLSSTRNALRASSERMFLPHELERKRHRVEAQKKRREREARLERKLERSLSRQLQAAETQFAGGRAREGPSTT